ncbi:hypothetical protein [Terriglobus roseus]|uniref:Apea-like HEPN domain-containing protein n=1 Tax=Terriglobus roseus TaxID=392734 RepID=A0A1G7QT16_9BACT|nr:hypothetical protein [Terriglobus roseus]SDG00800.1 hypothetical protein SAMN05444167_3961 [Terriglobus roseus]
MSIDTIHTALLGIAREGEDRISLGEGLSLVRPNDQLLAHRWDWAQGQGEMEQEAEAARYLVCEYPQWIPGESVRDAPERGANRFYAGLMAIQVIKPICTLGFVYRRQQIERRPPMEPGQWARKNRFDDEMLARVPDMIDRIQPVMDGKSVEQKNALTLLQLGLEHFHPYIAGLLWVTGLEAIFDSGGREEFKKKLCDCLGPQTLALPNWHSKSDAPTYTVEEIALPLYTLRNKLAHGADLRTASADKKHPVDFSKRVGLTPHGEDVNYALLLSEAACHLLCQVLQKVL